MKRRLLCVIVCVLFLPGAGSGYVPCLPGTAGDLSTSGTADLTVTLDLRDEKQTMKAFGASDCWSIQFIGQWPVAKRNAIADLLFSPELGANNNPRGIGLSSWRFNLGAGSSRDTNPATQIPNLWRRADTFLNETWDGYDWTRLPGQRWFLQAAKTRGVESFTLFTISPPVNLTKNGLAYCDTSVGTTNLPMSNAPAFARYLADVLAHFRTNLDIEFDYVSPFNEPQWSWNENSQEGCRYSNSDMRQVVNALHPELSARQLNTQILMAEAGDIAYLYTHTSHAAGNQIYQFFNTASSNYIGNRIAPIITGHSYWSDTAAWNLVSKRQSLKNRLNQYPGLSYAQTEYCILGDDGSGFELVGNGRDLGINPALRIARTIHYDLTMIDAVAWDWWLGVSPHNYKDGLVYTDFDTIDGNYYESKMLWGMGNFSRFIRPGMKRVEVHRSDNATPSNTLYGLMVSAYKNEDAKKAVVVFVNWLDEPRTVALDAESLNPFYFERWIPYVTSQTHNLAAHAALTTETVRIPARSIVTLVGSYSDDPALVAHYRFEGDTFDSSDRQNHGTANGSPSYADGQVGYAMQFDGIDSYVTLPRNVVRHLNEMTVAAWVRWNGGGDGQRIFDFGSDSSRYVCLTPRSSGGTLRFAIRNGGGEQSLAAAALTAGQWTHVAVTLGDGVATLYRNGRPAASAGGIVLKPSDFSPVNNYIGKSQGSEPLFNGLIDEFRIYNYKLSPSEIEQIHQERPTPLPWGGGPHALPGRIQAEHFDIGGHGIAYYDTTVGNSGGQLRSAESVDIFAITDSGGGYAVGDIETGEWLRYTVDSAAGQTGIYARVAAAQDGGQIKVWLDDDLLGTIQVPDTGSLTTWTTVGIGGIVLPDRQNAGLKLEFVGSGFRLNMIDFNTRAPFLGEPTPIPGRIQFEDFDIGGQWVSYFDKTPTNGYGHYRPQEPVDIMMIADDGAVGYAPFMDAGEWMEYTCRVERGYYTLVVRSSSLYVPQQFSLSKGLEALAVFALPQTGGFFNFQNTTVPNVYLAGGEMQLRFNMLTSSGVVNYVDFIREYNAADMTRSGTVDMDDFAILAAQWLGVPGVPSADIAPAGGDGMVDILDLLLLAENWLDD